MLSEADITRAIAVMKTDWAVHIFDQDVGESGQRKQLNLYEHGFGNSSGPFDLSFLEGIHEQVMACSPGNHHKVKYYPSLLYSPGVNDVIQPPHHDLPKRKYSKQTFLLLVALMDNTSIIVLHRSHKMQVRDGNLTNVTPVRILMDKGDYMMFHPALVHCGDAYQRENIRMHYYVLPRRSRIQDVTAFPSIPNMKRCVNPVSIRNLRFLETKTEKRIQKEKTLMNRRSAAQSNREKQYTATSIEDDVGKDTQEGEMPLSQASAASSENKQSARDLRAFNRDLERRIREEVEEIKKSEREFMARRAELLGPFSSGRFLPSYEPAPSVEPGFIGMPPRNQSSAAFIPETLPRALGVQSLQDNRDLFYVEEDDEGRVVYIEDDD